MWVVILVSIPILLSYSYIEIRLPLYIFVVSSLVNFLYASVSVSFTNIGFCPMQANITLLEKFSKITEGL